MAEPQPLEQKYAENDGYTSYIKPQSNLSEHINNGSKEEAGPPLIDMAALITPKQNKHSKKWSVGVNYTSTAIIFEYLESARLCIQNDGRLFIPSSKKTLSATHSSLPAQSICIPHISHISVPRTINFNNNSVIRINREWHIGELLPIMYSANINPPNINTNENIKNNNEYTSIHSKLSETMLVAEQPLSSDMDDDYDDYDDVDDNDNENESDYNNNKTYQQSPTKLYIEIWKHGLHNNNNDDGNKNIIAINKIIHDHNHNHDFFWSHCYDHDNSYYNKPKTDENNND
eukprot:189067_1